MWMNDLFAKRPKQNTNVAYVNLRPLEIPTWKWDSTSMNFFMGFPHIVSDRDKRSKVCFGKHFKEPLELD